MASDHDPALQKRLDRLQAAMGRRVSREERRKLRRNSRSPLTLLPIALAFVAFAIATGKQGLLIPGIVLAVITVARVLRGALATGEPDPTKPRIGMGADIAAGAVIEPGAIVEAGA